MIPRMSNYEIGLELRDSVVVQRYLFADRQRMGRIIRNACRHAATTRVILEYATGRRSSVSARRRLLSRSPQLALHLIWQGVRTLTTTRGAVQEQAVFGETYGSQ